MHAIDSRRQKKMTRIVKKWIDQHRQNKLTTMVVVVVTAKGEYKSVRFGDNYRLDTRIELKIWKHEFVLNESDCKFGECDFRQELNEA